MVESSIKVLVIGETCLDVFVYGNVDRLAPEAPAPVLRTTQQPKINLGMAANVRLNIVNHGVNCDLITNSNYEYVMKTRFVDDRTNTMFLRHDTGEEKIAPMDQINPEKLKEYDAVVISDYNKGLLTEDAIMRIGMSHPLVFLDTKKQIGGWCKTVHTIKINSLEYESSKHAIESDPQIRVNIKLMT